MKWFIIPAVVLVTYSLGLINGYEIIFGMTGAIYLIAREQTKQ